MFIVILPLLAQGTPSLCSGQDSTHELCQRGTIDASEAAQVVRKMQSESSVAMGNRVVPCVNQCTVPTNSFITFTSPGKR